MAYYVEFYIVLRNLFEWVYQGGKGHGWPIWGLCEGKIWDVCKESAAHFLSFPLKGNFIGIEGLPGFCLFVCFR